MRLRHRHKKPDSDLDITSFLNLMIILVPVLLVMMVFSRITVIDLQLPDIGSGSSSEEQQENDQLEVVLRESSIQINYPSNVLLKRIPQKEGQHDFELLSLTLQEVKRQLRDKGNDKSDILLLSEPETPYQTIVSAYDTVRSFKAVVAASVVDAELFPDISLGDAPLGPGVGK